MEAHFILCGLGRVGGRVLEYLRAAGVPVVVIDNRCAADDPRLGGACLISGDCRRAEVLESAGVAQARGVLILISDDLVGISSALMVRNLNPTVRIIVRMFNQNLTARLGPAVQNVLALSTSALVAPLFALLACTGKALGTFRLGDSRWFQVGELTVSAALAGKKISELLQRANVHAVAHVTATGKHFLDTVDVQATLKAGERLVICGELADMAALLAEGESELVPELHWAGWLQRHARVVWRTLTEVDLPVKICTAILFWVIIISVIVFHFGMKNDTLVDAFYRTISLMATGADMHGDQLEPGAWQKVFVSGLRLVGTALIAAFTAIFTNYLVRANLGGALEIRRIPESGHVIVCGLGNVGFRVAEELIRQGERVVAIERRRDNPFISTARRLGVAVIVADAGVPEVLRQAHAAQARALVVATDQELVNLEVALLARDVNPQQRVIVRLTDPHLAQTLRAAANVRLAMSIPELAAPAFVAAVFGERVRSLFQMEGAVIVVVDMVVQPNDPLAGLKLPDLAKSFHLLPVCLLGADLVRKPLDTPLVPGDRPTVILTLSDWQLLINRELPRVAPSPLPLSAADTDGRTRTTTSAGERG
jgi:Trk K+ transport system NAD-binding subunit